MDVLLINPKDETEVSTKLGLKVPPLNLMYLAGALEKASMSVKIIDDDLMQMGHEKVAKLVSKLNPSVSAITATTATIKTALRYVEEIERQIPYTLTVMGGPHTTFLPVETLKCSNYLDVVVIGEGEETIVDIAQKYEKNEKNGFSEIKGIAYHDNGTIKKNPPRPLIKNLDNLPFPARHLIPFESYGVSRDQSGGMITSRGCVFTCGYCSSSLIMGKKFRARSPENVVDEIAELVDKYRLRDIIFLDDTFMLNKRRAMAISNEIKSRGVDVAFVASSRVDTVDKELLSSLKTSGMYTLYYGVESGSQRVLDLMGKGITLKNAQEAVKIAKDVGIDVITSFILGYPGETPEEMDQTIDFSIKLDPDYSQYSILTPFPGTPVYYKLKAKKFLDTVNWDKYNVLNPVINYEKFGISKNLVKRKLAKAYLKFYLRPKYYIKRPEMLKVLIGTLFRTFILPKLLGGAPKGWYRNFEVQDSEVQDYRN
ncbi:MAG: radical SAM protein [Euryarchaeota archaeon]|nr:radical SAM protein [Euryarchaeota archaeon]